MIDEPCFSHSIVFIRDRGCRNAECMVVSVCWVTLPRHSSRSASTSGIHAAATRPGRTSFQLVPPYTLQPTHNMASVAVGMRDKDGSMMVAKVQPSLQQKSSRLGCLYAVTNIQPTNYDMLVFRTLNPLLGAPGHNSDQLAPLIRDKLMPIRSWWLKHLPWAKHQLKRSLENTLWGVPGCVNFIDARTKWFDQAVVSCLAAGIKQVVLIAAGYDTRPYRLSPPGGAVRFWEVDLPAASQRKAALASQLGLVPDGAETPVYVAADLSCQDLGEVLQDAGFDPNQPTLFTVEGLIYYLPEDAALALLARITRLAAPGSKVFFDFMHAAALEGRATSEQGYKYAGFKVTAKAVANKGEAYRFGLRDSPEAVAALLHAASSAAGEEGPNRGLLRLVQYLSPQDMVNQQLPHLKWNDQCPPIASFYSYAAAEKIVVG